MKQVTQSRGLFITLEGIEGVGKSTNVAFIKSWLEAQGITVLTTREPGGTPFAEKCRELLLLEWEENITSQAELMLLFAGRAQHLAEVIEPALTRGEWVLCDRFTDATYAYQGYGRGLPLAEIQMLETSVQKHTFPDLTLLFDAAVEIGQQRVTQRAAKKDRFENEHLAFFQRVREGYLTRANQFPQRFRVLDASASIENVQQQIVDVLSAYVTH